MNARQQSILLPRLYIRDERHFECTIPTVEEIETDLISTEETPGTYHSVVDGTTITNTYITEKTSVTVNKEWEGDPSQDGKSQPTSVEVILKANGTQVGDAVTLNEENEWTYTWSDLEKFSDGEEITYTVEEVETDLISSEEKEVKGKRKPAFQPPTLEAVMEYAKERGNKIDPIAFFDFYEANGWVQGKQGKPLKDWKAAVRYWERTGINGSNDGREKEFNVS